MMYLAAVQTQVLSIILLLIFLLLIVGAIFLIRYEQRRYKKDKYTLIDDYVKFDELKRLLEYRIMDNENLKRKKSKKAGKKKRKDVYFTLLLLSIDGFDQIGEYVSARSEKIYIQKLIGLLRMTLPKGGKIAGMPVKGTFLVYLPELYDEDELFEIAELFKNSSEKQIKVLNKVSIQKNASIAITTYPEQAKNVNELLNNLYMTMYFIKKSGGNEIMQFTDEYNRKGAYIEHYKELDNAINSGQFEMKFNPIYGLDKGHLCGVESVLNWQKDKQTPQNYKEFLPYLEESDDEFWFSVWALEKAVSSNINVYRLKNLKEYYITIVAGLKQFLNDDAAFVLQSTMDKYLVNPKFIIWEIDEILEEEISSKLIKNLQLLQGVGFKFAVNLNDFNENISDIIDTYNLDIIKINYTDFNTNTLQMLLNYAEKNCKKIVVNGIESKEQIEKLKLQNIDYVSGSLYGTMLSRDDLINLVDTII